ncbi:hypothetical protein BAUCODRAFT_69141 [Baudoinia panamericana UAMH 10762]|uniref:Amino acid permease/ SLC12A domain-containing protein n=1 Tax=Baudoinia panamericana (strain UAMH 10762) TaxID=717646 RepID=M2N016_BAUPA|nr:uncharacterized protein BAUCODRAFT_69141 [Baudoinia panamericana UAMH 10762]EMC97253.1 hypothetical protein BAUCODRAFT_69141 [Baudoinia panamericana UAMH 10762]
MELRAITSNNNDLRLSELTTARHHAKQDGFYGTTADKSDMKQLGITQQLSRCLSPSSVGCFVTNIIIVFEFVLVNLEFYLLNGGRRMLFLGPFMMMFVVTIMYYPIAQLIERGTTSGGQFEWVSLLVPRCRLLSYCVGWLGVIGWQAFFAAICYGTATMLQGLWALHHPQHELESWVGVMLTLLVIAVVCFVNYLSPKWLSKLELICAFIRVGNVALILAILWLSRPRSTFEEVMTSSGSGGWQNDVVRMLVGFPLCFSAFLGFDSMAHFSEETVDARKYLSKYLIGFLMLNWFLFAAVSITLAFTLGNIDSLLATNTGYPYIELVRQAFETMHPRAALGGTTVIVAFIIVANFAAALSAGTTACRQVWSFARSGGLPFKALKNVSQAPPVPSAGHTRVQQWKDPLPINALWVVVVVSALLALVGLGSSVALNAYNSLAGLALILSYIICQGALFIYPQNLPAPPNAFIRWHLWGIPCLLAMVTGTFLLVILPVTPHPSAASFPWQTVIFLGWWFAIGGFWVYHGNKHYTGIKSTRESGGMQRC